VLLLCFSDACGRKVEYGKETAKAGCLWFELIGLMMDGTCNV